VNLLQELLDAEATPSIADVRAATSSALRALRHDRRVEALGLQATKDLTWKLLEATDIRTLVRVTTPAHAPEMNDEVAKERVPPGQLFFEVVDPSSLTIPWARLIQERLAAQGGQMRITAVPYRVHVYDRLTALLPRDFDDNQAGALAIREPSLVASFVALHARLWRGGSRWNPRLSGLRSTGVDLADVLAQLLAGHTDEAAAQHLHISLRTYRRRVQELLTLLGTQSRFQAGAIASERRFVDLVRPPSWPEPAAQDPVVDALARVRSLPG
jgi:hypothetical protein